MRFGKLFKVLFLFPVFDENTFSSNRFSELHHAELRSIAKELNKYGFWNYGDYTHLTTANLAGVVFTEVNNLYNTPNYTEKIVRATETPAARFNNNLARYQED